MNKTLAITSLLGMSGIILGAFGAHALKDKLTTEALNSFETGVRYQMIHVLVLLFVNMYAGFTDGQKFYLSIFFIAGIIMFSGSVYAMHLLNISPKSIWFVTPAGGLLFILGWLYMAFLFVKMTK